MTPGTRLGSYEVVGPLGAGGMGEVYRARDTKLHRDVALKILPPAFTNHPDRVARFTREAQALAALNHPNIAQIFGIEDAPSTSSGAADTHAIVMELVEGEDLSERIARGPMPLDEALPIARQVALALEAAHDAGIVHRDLKPANIKIRQDGTVKVLDFGLAKAMQAEGGRTEMSPSISPTLTGRATELGLILGTAAYMAPEQAKGRAVDRRADVWAFGVVLFEMLTGRRAFAGDDVTEVMAAVLRDTPPLDALPAGTPAALRRLLRRCLEKDPRRRLRDMGDAGVELDDTMSGRAADEPVAATGRVGPVPSRPSVLTLAAGAMGLVALTFLAAWTLKPEAEIDRPLARFEVALPQGQAFVNYTMPNLAISRDGRRLAYRTTGGIFVRNLDELEAREVAKAPGAGVWFSPDGQMLMYGTTAGLSKVSSAGGPAQQLAAASQLVGADWADDGTILFSTGPSIVRIPEAGGTPQPLVESASAEDFAAWPQLLPGGKLLLYSKFVAAENAASTVVRSLADNTEQVVISGQGGTRYLDTGHLAYGVEDRLLVVPFDLATRTATAPPVPMPETVYVSGQSAWVQAAIARNGTLVYLSTREVQQQTQLVWVDELGKLATACTVPRVYSDPQLSPDGRRVALHLWDEDNDVWVADLVRGGLTRITFTSSEEETPVWSPDGRELAYAANRPGQPRTLFRRAADGSAAAVERKVWESTEHFHANSWSPDGRTIVVEIRRPNTANDILAIDVKTGEETVLLASTFEECQARFSRDGKWLAYTSDESGRSEVYVQPFPALDGRVPVSTAGGVEPIWSRDGRRLFFRSPTDIMAATVTSTSPLEFSAPEKLFADRFLRTQGDKHTHFDVGPDGRFLLIEDPRAGQTEAPELIFVALNWAETVKRLAPVK